ncbi:MAG: methyltransferase [Deltaproteobacteria bacterium]|nr:methyltransferase [Deltaproteobacteria bacterium]
MKRFTDQTMGEIINWCGARLQERSGIEIELPVIKDADDGYPGQLIDTAFGKIRYRTMQNVVDLAEALGCVVTPRRFDAPWLQVTLTPCRPESDWHRAARDVEKYGVDSPYQRIQKLEDPSFLSDLRRSLIEANVAGQEHLLNLGVNTGDELMSVLELNPDVGCVGIDHSPSAIAAARQRFAGTMHTFIEMDINGIDKIDASHHKRYDLFMSLGTLHSPGVDSKRVFMWCMRHLLSPSASVIIGFPNCRWVNGVPVFGARTKNRRAQDMSLVVKDVYFIKKYLQQHRFNTTIFGKYYLFVVGTKSPTLLRLLQKAQSSHSPAGDCR